MRKTSLFCALLLTCGVATAQQSGIYLGASVGRAKVDLDKNDLVTDLSSLGVTNISSSQDDTTTAWKIFAGYQFNPYLSLEGGYVDFGKYKVKVNGSSVDGGVTYKGDVDAQAVFADLVGHLPLMENALSIFGKVGGAYTRLKVSQSLSVGGDFLSDDERDNEFVWKLGAGFRYNFTKQFGVRAEYERYFNVGGNDTTGGQSDVGMWSIGATFLF